MGRDAQLIVRPRNYLPNQATPSPRKEAKPELKVKQATDGNAETGFEDFQFVEDDEELPSLAQLMKAEPGKWEIATNIGPFFRRLHSTLTPSQMIC